MKLPSQRTVFRWVHIVCGLPLIGFVYGPPEEVAPYAPVFRYVFVPVLVLSGLWLWKGHLITRPFTR